jgi:hypothetical protein
MTSRAVNPHWPTSAARMADGRLFTDYRPNCDLLAPKDGGVWADFERRAAMLKASSKTDRVLASMRAGSTNCVDTMVPELQKRVYQWNGPVAVGLSHAAGIGTGRLYLPTRLDLMTADPDLVAAETIPDSMLPGTYPVSGRLYGSPSMTTTVPAKHNSYSAPYGSN